MRHSFLTTDVFTDRRFGGNPLAVFPNASGIPEEALQRIAMEFNLSETTFVYPPSDARHTRRVRIFTPVDELPFAGHPTVGTAYALAVAGEIPLRGTETRVIFEEGVGPVPVLIRSENGRPTFCQLTAARLPETGPPPPDSALLAEVLSLRPEDLADETNSPQAFSCGLPFLFVPLRNRDAVRRARVRLDVWERVLGAYWARDIMVFSRDPEGADAHVRARVFGPTVNITEDPATGSACAALGGYLAAREPATGGAFRYVIEQGFEMGRPSIVELEVDTSGGKVAAVRVGGSAVMVMQGTIEI
ncbi:MAG: PhzF family phenazine biosynthesis protein [Gemmatimonadaceae bacterium]